MSFAQFANGAECGPANPMAGLMKQFHQDRSLQQVRCYSIRLSANTPIANHGGHSVIYRIVFMVLKQRVPRYDILESMV